MTNSKKRLPAEWEPQIGIQIAWPHNDTDWRPYLNETIEFYKKLTYEIAKREKLLIVAADGFDVEEQLETIEGLNRDNVCVEEFFTNDTWARDHAFISTLEDGKLVLNDFCFNGWGLKFPAAFDNQINAIMADRFEESFGLSPKYVDRRRIVLEGGSIESDGKGTILTTSSCLLAPNRNYFSNKKEAEKMLSETLGAERVLWIDFSYLAGDDTDGHVDTLVRLCPNDTIVYVQCQDEADDHYFDLTEMENELKAFRTADGKPYRLLPLPMVDAIYATDFDPDADSYERLPATYANFLIMNGAVLMPTYGQPENDRKAMEVLKEAFPDREIVGIDCRVLIRQHGSLHCVTMQYPEPGTK